MSTSRRTLEDAKTAGRGEDQEREEEMAKIEGTLGPYENAGVPVNGTDEVQTLTPSAAPASGTFKLKYEGFTTAALNFDASAAQVAAALNALPSIGASGVGVTLAAGVYTVTFSGANLAKRALSMLEVVQSTLKDAAEAAVDLVEAESVAGITATALGALKGAQLTDTANGELYINTGTPAAPTWKKITHA
jgi:hypothetical protein